MGLVTLMRRLQRCVSAGAALVVALALSLTVAFAQDEGVTVTLNPVDGSGVSGTATVQAEGDRTRITVSASGLAPGSQQTAIFGFGTCANIGFPALQFSVGDLVAGADGTATTSATVAVDLDVLLQNGPNQVHIATATAPNIACGDVPAVAAAATATPTAAEVAALPRTGGLPLPVSPAGLVGAVVLGLGVYLRRRVR